MIPQRQFEGLETVALPPRPLHVAIGMFDGVHLGHRAVIESAVKSARRMGGLAGVLTFWPHPSVLFRPEAPTRMIANREMRQELLADVGADFVVTHPFTKDFASIEAEEVVKRLKQHLPRLHTLYVGENWRFGKGRRGDIQLLIQLAKAEKLVVVSAQRINLNGEPISSTRIRACLTEGQIEEANELLGYSYFSQGLVTPGKQLGRRIGFPTLNVPWEPDLRPRLGVYAVTVRRPGGPALAAVANYGLRPTVEKATEPRLEIHVLETCPLDAGDKVVVEWLKFLRPEQAFAGVEALTAQISKDRDAALAYFAEEKAKQDDAV